MRLPTPLLRTKTSAYKNQYGHVLILGGSQRMLGAGALASLSAARSGAGLVTLGVPKGLNAAAHKKTDNIVMTWPLNETREQSLAFSAYTQIKKGFNGYAALALGPGLSQNAGTQKLIRKIIETSPIPLIIDADALNALKGRLKLLTKTATPKVLTPHPGEMARLTGQSRKAIEGKRKEIAERFAKQYGCTLLLKGSRTVVATAGKRTYTNTTGNSGMASAGSGDVLTGIITAFIGQGLNPHEAAKYAALIHGKAGDLAAKKFTKLSMTASDIIDFIPRAVKHYKK